ncbi:MAG: hypothetical protein FJ276_19110 [Planctomycetes bacterium]|nr:hypothetical protein [Planctomycetota bacterium]
MTRVNSSWQVLLILTSFAVLVSTARAADVPASAEKRPNILFFLTDDQPQIGMGCMGNRHIRTPHHEQLFDLTTDPQELTNLAGDAAQAAILAQLRARCDEYREQLR